MIKEVDYFILLKKYNKLKRWYKKFSKENVDKKKDWVYPYEPK